VLGTKTKGSSQRNCLLTLSSRTALHT